MGILDTLKAYAYALTGIFIVLITSGLVIGGSGSGTLSNPGHPLNEIQGYNSNEDLADTITDIYSEISDIKTTLGLNLQCNQLIIDTGLVDVPNLVAIDMPADCTSTIGCMIRQEIYDSTKTIKITVFNYIQDPSTNIWTSDLESSGLYKNGDTDSRAIVANYGYLYIWDDYSGTDTVSDKWMVSDIYSNLGQKVYHCTVS